MPEVNVPRRIGELPPYLIQRMMVLASQMEQRGEQLLHLEVGEPDFNAPPHVVEAMHRAVLEGQTKYTPAMGLLSLRQAIAETLLRERDVKVDAATQVIVTPGAKHAIFCALMATVENGEAVILPDPGFPSYEYGVRMAGGVPIHVPLDAQRGFELDVEEIERQVTPHTRLIVVNSPHNPTGSVASKDVLRRLVELAQRRGLLIISDEVYDKFVYDGFEHTCVASLPGAEECCILVNSFSKTYAMTGWRLAYAAGPRRIIEAMRKVQEGSTTCATTFCQVAGIAALRGSQDSVRMMCHEFDGRRRLLLDALARIEGVDCHAPHGAFFVFPNVKSLGISSIELAERLLQVGVVVVPGVAFGNNGEGYLRLSYATTIENIFEAAARVRDAVLQLRGNNG